MLNDLQIILKLKKKLFYGDTILENRLALQSGQQTPAARFLQTYSRKALLPTEIDRQKLDKHAALVTSVNVRTDEVFVQFYKYSAVQRELQALAVIERRVPRLATATSSWQRLWKKRNPNRRVWLGLRAGSTGALWSRHQSQKKTIILSIKAYN